MRSALLLLAVAFAGCMLPDPAPMPPDKAPPMQLAGEGTPAADPSWTDAPREETAWWTWNTSTMMPEPANDTWIARWTPGNLTGAPGEVARVHVDVRPTRANASEARFLVPAWARAPEGGSEFVLPPEGASFDLDVLLGPRADLQITILAAPAEGECCRHAFLHGPKLGIASNATFAPVVARAHYDPVDVPRGLSVDAIEGGVVVTWSFGTWKEDCSASVTPLGDFAVVERDGGRALLGAVEAWSSDACMLPAPTTTPRVVAQVDGLEPGPLRVILFSHVSGMIIPPAWTEETEDLLIRT